MSNGAWAIAERISSRLSSKRRSGFIAARWAVASSKSKVAINFKRSTRWAALDSWSPSEVISKRY